MKPFIVIVAVVLAVFALCVVDSKACDVAATVPAFSQGYLTQAAFTPAYAPAFAPGYAPAQFAPTYYQQAPIVLQQQPVAFLEVRNRRHHDQPQFFVGPLGRVRVR